jgi:hypothetical protein
MTAPNAAAIKNARGVVLKRKLVGLFRSADGTLIFGDCKGSGAENYRPSADFADPSKPVFRCTCPSRQFPCKHSLALLSAHPQAGKFVDKELPTDIIEKRTKIQARAEKKKVEADKPRQVNTSALKKRHAACEPALISSNRLSLTSRAPVLEPSTPNQRARSKNRPSNSATLICLALKMPSML